MNRLVSLISALAMSVLMVVAGTGCTAKVRAAVHLRRADNYFQSGQYDRAEIEYKLVLRNAPQNAQAWSRLGIIYFEDGRLGEAAQILDRARTLDTNNLEVRVKLATIYLAVGQRKQAQAEADFVLGRAPADAKAPILAAEAAATNQLSETRSRLQTLSQKGDTAPLAVALGTIAFREHDLKTAQVEFEHALKLDSKFSDAYSALGNVYLAQKEPEHADQAFQNAAEFAPPRSGKALQYAEFKIATGDPSAGRHLLEELAKQAPDYLPVWLALAQLDAAGQKYADGAAMLGNVLSRDPQNFEGLLLQNRLYVLQGKTTRAIAGLEKMAEMFPRVPAVRYQLALAYLATNQTDKAVLCLNQAVGISPQFVDAILLRAQIQIQRGRLDSAMASLQQLIQREPQLVAARLLMANAYRVRGDWTSAVDILQGLETANPNNVQLHLLLGTAFLQQKRTVEARKEFSLAIKLAPDFLPALEQLVNLDLKEKQFAAATRRIQSVADQHPNQVEVRLLMAKILLAEDKNDQAEAYLQETIKLAPENQGAYLMLAQMYHAIGKNPQALAKLNSAVAKDPRDITALMLTAVIYNQEKDYQKAADTYEKLLQVNPRFSPALNNLAYLYSESFTGRLNRAYELARSARDLNPYDPSTADTLGWICLKRGSYTVALSLLQESVAKLSAEPEVRFHLGMAYYMTGDESAARNAFQTALQSDKAFSGRDECQSCLSILAINAATADASNIATLERRIAEKPDDPAALNRLAAIYEREGNSDKAIAACEAILRANPDNLAALLQLAQVYAPKNVARAMEMAQNAYKLAPDNPEVCQLYGNLASQSGNYKLAANLFQLAVQGQPDNAEALFGFAQAAYHVGRVTEAQAALQKAQAGNLDGPQAREARQMVELIQVANAPAKSSVVSAQVAGILKSRPDYLPALEASVAIKKSQGDPATAAQTCEKILDRYPDFTPAIKQLAQLYAGDPAKIDRAYALAVEAREAYPGDPAVAKTLGMILVEKGDFNRALNLLKQSAETSTDAETFYYLGTTQFKLNQRADSKASLQRALDLNLTGKQAQSARQMLQLLD